MAVVCDLCNKPPRTRGPGQDMWSVQWACQMSGGVSIHVELITPERYMRTAHAVCGACLDKMGVLDLLAAEAAEEADRRRRQAERASNVIDVTPPGIRQIGPRRMRLLGAGE